MPASTQLEVGLGNPPIVHVDDVSGTATTFGPLPAALRWIIDTVEPRLDQPYVAARADLVRAGQWQVLRAKSASAMSRVRERLTP